MVGKILLIILVVLVLLLVGLYFLGRRMQKKQAEQQAHIEDAKQNVSMLNIDKNKKIYLFFNCFKCATRSGAPVASIAPVHQIRSLC